MNPLDELFENKTAGITDAFRNFGGEARKAMHEGLPKAIATGVGTAAAGAVAAGAGYAASKIYDAITKQRDFRAMLASPFNADLHQFHKTQPKLFNEAFSSLRTMNPGFTKDPMVAGTYMRRMMEYGPLQAGGVLLDALGQREKMPPSPMAIAAERGAMGGAQAGMIEGMKGKPNRTQEMAMAEYFKRLPRVPESMEKAPAEEYYKHPGVIARGKLKDIAIGKHSLEDEGPEYAGTE